MDGSGPAFQDRSKALTPTSAERGQETRARLLDAAARLIVSEGWGAVTTRKVAALAGLRPGLVHYHFDTVNDLLIDAALETAHKEVEGVMAMLGGVPEGREGLAIALAGIASYSVEESAAILSSEMLLAATRNERLRVELTRLLTRWREMVTGWLQEHGATEDAEGTAVVLGAVIDGLLLHRLLDPGLSVVPVQGPLRRLLGLTAGQTAAAASGSRA